MKNNDWYEEPGFTSIRYRTTRDISITIKYPDYIYVNQDNIKIISAANASVQSSKEREAEFTILKKFPWDGSSVIKDTKRNIRASVFHEAAYHLIRKGIILKDKRVLFDNLFVSMCKLDGTWKWLANIYGWALKLFGDGYC